MFGFLKDKLKEVMGKFSKKIDEEAKTVEVVEEKKPEPKPITESKPAPKPAPKEEPKAQAKTEAKAEPKSTEHKPEPKSVPKPEEKKPEPKPATKPEPQPSEEKSKPQPQKAPEAKVPGPKPITESKPAPKPAPKEEPKAQEKPEPKPEPKPAPKSEPKHTEEKPKPSPKEEPAKEEPKEEKKGFLFGLFKKKEEHKEEPEEKPKPEPQKAPEAKKPEAKPTEAKKPEVKPSPKEEPKAQEKPEPKPEPKHIPESKPVIQAEPKPEPEPRKAELAEIAKQIEESEEEKPKGIFGILKDKITKKELSEQQFDEIFWELEVILLENNVAVEVIEKIKADLKASLVGKQLERSKIDDIIQSTLKKTIDELFDVERIDLIEKISLKKPYVICFVGINGSGKTTTIAKLAHILKKRGITSVIAAGDTFRAAAIQQLEEHANRINIKLIKHDYGADSAAVAFDAISHAKAHNLDVVLIDTAGRLHSNANLMDEIKKVKRVTKPDLVLFVGESITGNDCVEQAKTFNAELGIDGIILSKADVDEKGGAAISISYVTKKPILYLGVGQGYDDLIEFNPQVIVESLGL